MRRTRIRARGLVTDTMGRLHPSSHRPLQGSVEIMWRGLWPPERLIITSRNRRFTERLGGCPYCRIIFRHRNGRVFRVRAGMRRCDVSITDGITTARFEFEPLTD